MKNSLVIDLNNCMIIMDRTFAKKVENTMSNEYEHLQRVRKHYPKFTVVQRHIKKNDNKKTYKGLTYEYMEEYIMTHGTSEVIQKNLAEFLEKRLIAECHSNKYRYPVIKEWFLKKYPDVCNHGLEDKAKVIETIAK